MSNRNKTLEELNLLVEIQLRKQELVVTMKRWRVAQAAAKAVILLEVEKQLVRLDGLEDKEAALGKLENEKHSKEVSSRGLNG